MINSDHYYYLCHVPSNSFDVVYFDPMFRHPQHHSTAIKPLRQLADHRPLDEQSITEACRVARKKVVIKETRSSKELERLGVQFIVGSHHNPIAYGVIEP
ncbi:class I SAM-dependent methyltransferase [Syntrophomonas palmitatica]|uniref:class I SAM-dependent methyltransferase n=1 Tax=Syntrophomonas palmitatica TaxID=402877 RepID=UPI0006CF6FC0|nr:class I SAM-dependent methyltransferase [Syntrophomonas palmitatica]